MTCTTSFASAATPGVVRPTAAELERAYGKHDAVELERLSRRLGAPRLLALAERGSGKAQEAALAGLATIDESLEVLPRITALVSTANPTVAALALETVRRLGERMTRGEASPDEQPKLEVRTSYDALADFAAKDDRTTALRISAIQAMGALQPLVRSTRLDALTAAKDPSVRRAVAEALPSSSAALVPLVTNDTDVLVAASAAATLCHEVPPPGAERKADKALARANELPPAARERMRTIAADPAIDESVRLDVVPCLRKGAQPATEAKADAAALSALAKGPASPLQKRVRAYGGR